MKTQATINTKWFRAQLMEREMSMRGLAKKMNLDPASVSLMLRGMRRMTNAEAHTIATLFGVRVTEVLRQAGVPITEDVHTVTLLGTVDARACVKVAASTARYQVPVDVPADGFALQVRCATSPADGWLILCASPMLQPEAALERLAMVTMENGTRMVGTLKKGYDNGFFNIVTTIPATDTLENQSVTGANPVLWIRPR